ncbi:MAG: hypothetical protein PHH28_08995 [Desulfuromonadaceae bacterium]|nr:hypothetical protein [Desulfuromonadaceae bacterium]
MNNQVPVEGLYMNGSMEISERLLTGTAIADILENVATLRIEIFPEYPYLTLCRGT